MQAQADSAAINGAHTKLTRLKRLARIVLQARDAEAQAKKDIAKVRDEIIALADELGLSTVEAVAGRGLQIVHPVSRKVIGNDDLVKAIARHRPEWLDTLAPAKRTVSLDALSWALDGGNVPASWAKHIVQVEGTVQLRATEIR